MSRTERPVTARVRPVAFLILLAIGVAASSSHSGRSLALTNGGNMTALDVPLVEDFNTLASSWDQHSVAGRLDNPRLVLEPLNVQLRHRLVEHWSALQLRRGGSEPGHGSRAGFGCVRLDHNGVSGRETLEQHRRDDHVARRELHRRAVAQRRQHDSAYPHIPVPGGERRLDYGRRHSGERLDDLRAAQLHWPCSHGNSRGARRECASEPSRDFRDALGHRGPQSGDLAAVAGSG